MADDYYYQAQLPQFATLESMGKSVNHHFSWVNHHCSMVLAELMALRARVAACQAASAFGEVPRQHDGDVESRLSSLK